MLTLPEKIIFAIFALSITGYAAWKTNQIAVVMTMMATVTTGVMTVGLSSL